MSKRKQMIAGLLKRYRIIDFAEVISLPLGARKAHLQKYLDRDKGSRWKTYTGFMSMIPDIAGVARGLDPSDIMSKSDIHAGLKLRCHKDDLGFNTSAADALFDFVRPRGWSAYADHHRRDLRVGPDRTISMGIEHYVVDGERGAFQFVYPRQKRLEGSLPDILMSLIHHNYVDGDFEGFDVEIVDLSCEPILGPRGGFVSTGERAPRILGLSRSSLITREDLNHEANSVYELLLELSQEE